MQSAELREAVGLDDGVIELIARRVAAILREEQATVGSGGPKLVSAEQIAQMFSVSRKWVYDNATFLGAVKLGTGAKPRLRFDPAHVRKMLATSGAAPAARAQGPRRRRRWIDDADLIPLS